MESAMEMGGNDEMTRLEMEMMGENVDPTGLGQPTGITLRVFINMDEDDDGDIGRGNDDNVGDGDGEGSDDDGGDGNTDVCGGGGGGMGRVGWCARSGEERPGGLGESTSD